MGVRRGGLQVAGAPNLKDIFFALHGRACTCGRNAGLRTDSRFLRVERRPVHVEAEERKRGTETELCMLIYGLSAQSGSCHFVMPFIPCGPRLKFLNVV